MLSKYPSQLPNILSAYMTFHTSHEHCFLHLQQVVISCDDGPKTASVKLLTGSPVPAQTAEVWRLGNSLVLWRW